jgi:hypothetical protein
MAKNNRLGHLAFETSDTAMTTIGPKMGPRAETSSRSDPPIFWRE